jgi:MFS family permease
MAPFSLMGPFLAGALADRFAVRYLLITAQGVLLSALLWSVTISITWQALVYGGLLGLTCGFDLTGSYSLGIVVFLALPAISAAAAAAATPPRR